MSKKAISVLRQLEWSGTYSYCTGWSCCPVCNGIKPGVGRDADGDLPTSQGHYDSCKLNNALLDCEKTKV